MKEFESAKYKAIVRDDGLLTVTNGPRILRQTTFKDGNVEVQDITQETAPDASYQKLLARMNQMPVFVACWAGNRRWNVDIDCGMQRFNGVKPHGQLIKALKNCSFDEEQIKEIVSLCKGHKWDYCPHQW